VISACGAQHTDEQWRGTNQNNVQLNGNSVALVPAAVAVGEWSDGGGGARVAVMMVMVGGWAVVRLSG